MEGSDSDVEEIPRNPNRHSTINPIQNPNSHWNSNSNKTNFGNPNRNNNKRNYHKRGGAKSKNGFSKHNTDNYFEQARQAQLLGAQVDQINHALNNNGKNHNFNENEGQDKGKGIEIETSEKRVNGSRFHCKKPFRKNKYGFNNHNNNSNNFKEEGSSSFNGQRKLSLVRNGCISPQNVNKFNANANGNSVVNFIGIENSASNGKEKTEINEPQQERKQNDFMRKRKHNNEISKLGESSDSISQNPKVDLNIINSSSEEGSDFDWNSLEGLNCDNQELGGESAKITQIESDEMLARRLQEQFNREVRGNFEESNEEDDDAAIARVLVDNDDDNSGDNDDDNDEMNNRDELMDLFPQEPIFPLRVPQLQIANIRRTETRNFTNPNIDFEMSIISRISRTWGNSDMDMDARLNMLEALEAAYENNSDMDMDFSDDYEILSTLDEENHQHMGASDNQINRLPVSNIKGGNSEDSCAICLETPAVGAEMRHLPCLHKFHKDCIDTWLKRRNTCPVCKLSINST